MRGAVDTKVRGLTTRKHSSGFSLAETLTVVAILIILAGVGFIAVIRWRAILRQLELDETAKELYMAAQNHLSFAESQGLLSEQKSDGTLLFSDRGKLGEAATATQPETRYFIYSPGNTTDTPDDPLSVLSLMLPDGSIDVRTSGSYMVRYEPETATILDVFYTDGKDGYIPDDSYSALMSVAGASDAMKVARRNVGLAKSGEDTTGIVGWYSGTGGDESLKLMAPVVKIDNGDILSVKITDPYSTKRGSNNTKQTVNEKLISSYNSSHSDSNISLKFRLIVEGKTSKAVAYKDISKDMGDMGVDSTGPYAIVALDDVTSDNGVFDDLTKRGFTNNSGKTFYPGEDISVYAWVSSTGPSTAAKSATAEANSLFASAKKESSALKVEISSLRHLVNLSNKQPNNVSAFDSSKFITSGDVAASQITDLSWSAFAKSVTEVRKKLGVSIEEEDIEIYFDGGATGAGKFLPVYPSNRLDYDGCAHRIAGITVDTSGVGGIFAKLGKGSISNLEVVNASISSKGTGAASGALLGELVTGVTTENILVRTTLKTETISGKTITSSGNAGGLVGTMSGGTISKCAASVRVKSTGGSAGGLVGEATGGTITSSYSGGHTTNGLYDTTSGKADVISASGNAGGLVGTSSVSIDNCYSTCSVSGATEGGLAGSITGGSVSQTYVTGWVNPTASTTPGAFAGSSSVASGASNYYYKIINNVTKTEGGKEVTEPMQPVGSNASSTLAAPFDAMDEGGALTTFYKVYTGGGKSSAQAIPYDEQLAKLYVYNGKAHYAFQCIDAWADLKTPATPTEGTFTAHLTRHYGDWPAPETLVVNTQ